MSDYNLDKIKKEIDKCDLDKLPELYAQIKGYMNEKLVAQSTQYSDLAEHYQRLAENIKQ